MKFPGHLFFSSQFLFRDKMEHNRQKKDPSCNKKVTSSHPYETANWFTRASLGWMNSILRLGSKRPLVKEDIFPVRTEDSMEYLVSKLKSEWQHEINSCLPSDCKPRLWRAFTRMFSWKAYTLMFVLVLCRFLCTILLPTLMWFFLSEFVRESQGDASTSSYVFVTGIIILALFKGFSKNHSASMAEIWSNRLKVSCIGLIYEKVIVFPLYRFMKRVPSFGMEISLCSCCIKVTVKVLLVRQGRI